MPDRYLYPDPNYLRALTARDPFAAEMYVRRMRHAQINATISMFVRFVWRQVMQRFKALPERTFGEEPLHPIEAASARKEDKQ